MASISVPCPRAPPPPPAAAARGGSSRRNPPPRPSSTVPVSKLASSPIAGYGSLSLSQLPGRRQLPVLKAQVQEVSAESSTHSSLKASAEEETLSSSTKGSDVHDESAISALMAEASRLVMLVDSKDLTELKLKHNDCELIIRKKEAFSQSLPTAPTMIMQHPQAAFPPPPMPQPAPAVQASASTAAPAPSPTPALPPATKGSSKSSLPPLKCPMAGTFYRSAAPGEPPFVKIGDKVQKGQVVCIIEAMKLMNEIEADQSGTIVEILAEDGKPVSVDSPLMIIQP
uniref:Biotin carboxyl carrier protein of acetyl-CoA carboxylase n=1 Tax=Ananas comosus var. bracteatus TaxID=296719 RepID=A0A6V7Q419_ANACO|nr:unnamed protein product [Ananas comosus var. bracteatus]